MAKRKHKPGTPEAVLAGEERWCLLKGDLLDVLPRLPKGCIDSVISDPPYSSYVHGKQRRMLRGRGGRKAMRRRDGGFYREVGLAPLDFEPLTTELRAFAAKQFGRLVRRFAVIFSDAESAYLWRRDLSKAALKHIREGAWIKLNCQPQLSGTVPATGFEALQISRGPDKKRWNGGGHPGVWFHAIATDRNQTGARIHTAQKPLSLMLELIKDFTDPDEVVLDPFAGSGTTGAACIQLGRRFIGVEKDPTFYRAALKRLHSEVQGLVLKEERHKQLDLNDLLGVKAS